ncbi:MAG: hypothetical protein AAF824_15415 [Bacteroidota bacterium]
MELYQFFIIFSLIHVVGAIAICYFKEMSFSQLIIKVSIEKNPLFLRRNKNTWLHDLNNLEKYYVSKLDREKVNILMTRHAVSLLYFNFHKTKIILLIDIVLRTKPIKLIIDIIFDSIYLEAKKCFREGLYEISGKKTLGYYISPIGAN